jgi:hypothetical protein
MDLQALIPIIIGLIVIAIVWRIIKGVVRLVITLALVGFIAYVVINAIG